MENSDRLAAFLERMKRKGKRLTPQRLAIVQAVLVHGGHPTVEQIHRQILPAYPTTSLATVYKTISLLKEEGEILELEFGERGNRYDGIRPKPHPHMVCTRCGTILDLELSGLEADVARLAREVGFEVESHRLDIFGICPACKQKG
ncbi:MAG: Fur family transcriptional regulator peroxide stress response [Desulfovibrionaceae bacterium]|nr:MAG: Fur family transcriptional regulator peroxide stress response [Desulfovibrionaceae bacterium]